MPLILLAFNSQAYIRDREAMNARLAERKAKEDAERARILAAQAEERRQKEEQERKVCIWRVRSFLKPVIATCRGLTVNQGVVAALWA